MNKPKLERCPCCDSKAILAVNPYDEGFEAIIYCTGGAEVGCFMRSRHWAAKKSWAIKSAKDAWNRRAPLPDNKALTCEGCMYKIREGWNYEHCVRCARHWPDSYRRPPEKGE